MNKKRIAKMSRKMYMLRKIFDKQSSTNGRRHPSSWCIETTTPPTCPRQAIKSTTIKKKSDIVKNNRAKAKKEKENGQTEHENGQQEAPTPSS